jgi:hypothetical protein
MTASPVPVLASFPLPSDLVARMLDELRLAVNFPPQTVEEMRRVSALPRPWEPAECPPVVREHLWSWLRDVVVWINAEHTWRVDRMIPECWAEHPHIVRELLTVTCLRHEASLALSPHALEDWHRVTLPVFLDRMVDRIGAHACPPGRHQEHPGTTRMRMQRSPSSVDAAAQA